MVINDFPNYEIFEDGSIFAKKKGIFLVPQPNGTGYLKHVLYNDKGYKNLYVHRLVATHFLPASDDPSATEIDHIDRNKLNNHVTNLRYVTPKQNMSNMAGEKRYKNQTSLRVANVRSKEEVQRVKDMFIEGTPVCEIGRILNIPRQSVSRYVKALR